MRLSTLSLASAFVWLLAAGGALGDSRESATAEFDLRGMVASDEAIAAEWVASASEEGPAGPAPVAESESVRGDDFDLSEAADSAPTPQAVRSQSSASFSSIPLGPMGVDENGVEGRIHTVAKGDTLWDISDAYLGTPWVWPGIWYENDNIENPHVIVPGDRIWITSNEMRRLSEREAEEMIAAMPVADEGTGVDAESQKPELADAEPQPAAIEDASIALPIDPTATMTGEMLTLPYEQTLHFSSVNTIEQASRIVDSPTLRNFLTQGDVVYLPLGKGEVSTGDEFTIFRDIEEIRDVGTGAVIGYHFDERGWLEITSVNGEASTGVINGATSEMQRGDRLIPRIEKPRDVPVRIASSDVEASIVFMPGIRWMVGSLDSVYLNVGSIHGVEIGTQMEVYQAGQVQDLNAMPDTVVARMVVISVESEISVAFVTQTVRELEVGDHVRGVLSDQFAVR